MPTVNTRLTSTWLPLGVLIYTSFAALGAAPGSVLPWMTLILVPTTVWAAWRRLRAPRGEDQTDETARQALAAALFGAGLFLAARSAPAGRPGFDAAANLGTGIVGVSALIGLARIAPLGGLLRPPKTARSLDAAAFAGLLWGIAVALPATRAVLPPTTVLLDPLAVDYATTTAGVGNLLVMIAATWRLRATRRFELGVGDRAAGSMALAVTAFAVAVPAAAADVAAPDRILPTAVIIAGLAIGWATTTAEPTRVSTVLRGTIAVLVLGVPTTLFAGVVAKLAPAYASTVALGASIVAIGVGLVARAVAKPLGPEQSRWLDAIHAASQSALQPEPDAALRAALEALAETSDKGGARPELWRVSPPQVLSVDIASYLHIKDAEAPPRLYELASGEPERTLRADTLKALEVRRPDLRPLLAWFENKQAFSATIVQDDDGPLGFLSLPRGNRDSAMSLEEARAARMLTDRISALLSVSSALARSREREIEALAKAAAVDDERLRLEHLVLAESGNNRAYAELVARPVSVSCYSPAARLCRESIERMGRMGGALTLVAPYGVNPAPWGALHHLAGPRDGGRLVLVDCANMAEHDVERWADPGRSPLTMADGGTLLLLETIGLPLEVQEQIVRSLGRQAVDEPTGTRGPALVANLPEAPEHVSGLHPRLAAWLGTECVRLPALAQRAEDLRALAIDVLARLGVRHRGAALGLDAHALHLLQEHHWPGNDAELKDVLTRAAQQEAGQVITAASLASIGFRPVLEDGSTATPAPPSVGQRRPRRRPRRR